MEEILRSVGCAGTAAVLTVSGVHPIDVIKTRLQVSGDGSTTRNYRALGLTGTIKVVAAEEGLTSFWKGISPAWFREATYTSLRIGLYGPIKNMLHITNDSSFFMKFMAGSLTGAIGSVVGNPFDVLKTKLMATESKTSHALTKAIRAIIENQGMGGFYRGIQANIMRAAVLNGTSMSCYDQIQHLVKSSHLVPEGLPTHFTAAFGAGFFMAVTVSPFDMVRTKLMNQPVNAKLYSGFTDCVIKLVSKGGIMGLYAGFVPIWARFAPTTVLQLVFFEQLKPLFGISNKKH